MQKKDEALEELRAMFREVLAMSSGGGNHARISRAMGRVDGYMRALVDLDVATRPQLLDLVARERARAHGPATVDLEEPVDDSAVA